jgi:hypothetical protein
MRPAYKDKLNSYKKSERKVCRHGLSARECPVCKKHMEPDVAPAELREMACDCEDCLP